MLGGVCAGVGRSAGLDPLLLRVAVVAVTVLTGGAGLLAYLAAWVLVPREPVDTAPVDTAPVDTAPVDTALPGTAAPHAPAAEVVDHPADTAGVSPTGTVPAPRPPADEPGERPGAPVAGQDPPRSCASS